MIFHFRHDLLEALVTAIGYLNKGKPSVLTFFRGAGVPRSLMEEEDRNQKNLSKFAIARNILTRLNEQGDNPAAIRHRRQVARRVVEWEDFSTCWPDDELKAKGAVHEVRRIINVHDSFTRLQQANEAESQKHRSAKDAEAQAAAERALRAQSIKDDFYALFGETDVRRRGIALEGVLNRLFEYSGILIREAFIIRCDESGKPLEQIDGVIEIDHVPYLVEMKWCEAPIGVPEVSQHLSRLFLRMRGSAARGMYISYSGFTDSAIDTARDGITAGAMIFMCTLLDFVQLMERKDELIEFCRERIRLATIEKQPFVQPTT